MDEKVDKILAMMKSPDEANRNIALMQLIGGGTDMFELVCKKLIDSLWDIVSLFFDAKDHEEIITFFGNQFRFSIDYRCPRVDSRFRKYAICDLSFELGGAGIELMIIGESKSKGNFKKGWRTHEQVIQIIKENVTAEACV